YGKPLRVELPRREAGTAYTHTPISTEAWTYMHDYVHDSVERVTHPRDPGDLASAATAMRVVGADRVTSTDEDGRVVTYFLDGYDGVLQIQRLPIGAGPIATTSFLRTTAGNITRITDPDGQISSYGRNLLGWETSFTAPDNGVTSFQQNDRGQVTST